jgi:hypothetical protein
MNSPCLLIARVYVRYGSGAPYILCMTLNMDLCKCCQFLYSDLNTDTRTDSLFLIDPDLHSN